MATRIVENYTGTRISVHSDQPFESVVSKLYSSIGTPDKAEDKAKPVDSLATSSKARDTFIAKVKSSIGPHGFMIFQVSELAPWPCLSALIEARRSTMERGFRCTMLVKECR